MYAWAALVSFSAVALTFIPLLYVVGGFLVGFVVLVKVMRRPNPAKITPTKVEA
jgi:membrane-associated phospholipid phosphatase